MDNITISILLITITAIYIILIIDDHHVEIIIIAFNASINVSKSLSLCQYI